MLPARKLGLAGQKMNAFTALTAEGKALGQARRQSRLQDLLLGGGDIIFQTPELDGPSSAS